MKIASFSNDLREIWLKRLPIIVKIQPYECFIVSMEESYKPMALKGESSHWFPNTKPIFRHKSDCNTSFRLCIFITGYLLFFILFESFFQLFDVEKTEDGWPHAMIHPYLEALEEFKRSYLMIPLVSLKNMVQRPHRWSMHGLLWYNRSFSSVAWLTRLKTMFHVFFARFLSVLTFTFFNCGYAHGRWMFVFFWCACLNV